MASKKQAKPLDRKLMQAAKAGDSAQVHRLLNEGANVNAVDWQWDSALYQAASTGARELVELLLERGADPNHLEGGKTPLMEAVYCGHRGIIDILIDAGANVFAKMEVANGVFVDVPQCALEAGNKKLAAELRSLFNQQKHAKDGRRLRLKDVADQLNLDEQGKPIHD